MLCPIQLAGIAAQGHLAYHQINRLILKSLLSPCCLCGGPDRNRDSHIRMKYFRRWISSGHFVRPWPQATTRQIARPS